jgi:hypothetical protein
MEIHYQRIKNPSATPAVVELIAGFYGPGFFSEQEALPFVQNKNGHFIYGAFDSEDKLLGVCLGKTLGDDRLGYYTRLVGDLLTNDFIFDLLDSRSGAISVLVISPEIGDADPELAREIIFELAERVLNKLSQLCSLVFADLWSGKNDDEYDDRRSALARLGFKKFRVIKNFWTGYTERMPEAICPICGNPCHCSAEIFYKRISASPLD